LQALHKQTQSDQNHQAAGDHLSKLRYALLEYDHLEKANHKYDGKQILEALAQGMQKL